MAITVKHTKISSVPDSADTSLVRPSDWNDTHTLTGFGTAAELNAGSANGVATLDAGGTVPLSQIPASIQGGVSYQGTWNATTNTPTLTSSVGTKGYYYVVSVAGSTNLNGVTNWNVGDWAIFNGSAWEKVDNTDAVTSVNGYTGTVVLTQSDISGTVAIANGGTGQTTANSAFNALAPSQSGNTGKYLTTDGTNTSWSTNAGGDVVGPSSATDNALARYDTTTGKLIQNSVVTIDDAGNIENADSLKFSGTPPTVKPIGSLWFDLSNDTLNLQQNNIVQQIGEELYVYGKASNTITGETLLQVIVKTGAVGASGVIEFGVAGAGITDTGSIIGIATENIATNGFGRITNFGVVHGINTTGSTYGETWADGDDLWYNPVTGGITKTKPSAPNLKTQLGTIIHAGAGGSGSFQVLILEGTILGGTDSNVNIVSPTAAQILTYSTTDAYWKNTSLASGTGISTSTNANGTLTVTNTAPDQTVAISAGTGISVSGTYPSFTVTNSGVTSLTGTASQVTVSASTGGVTLSLPSTINVNTSGNAGTVTNGVYTTGSYADPTWITSLAGSKISGTIDGGTF
jgi:hypothetical protein